MVIKDRWRVTGRHIACRFLVGFFGAATRPSLAGREGAATVHASARGTSALARCAQPAAARAMQLLPLPLPLQRPHCPKPLLLPAA